MYNIRGSSFLGPASNLEREKIFAHIGNYTHNIYIKGFIKWDSEEVDPPADRPLYGGEDPGLAGQY